MQGDKMTEKELIELVKTENKRIKKYAKIELFYNKHSGLYGAELEHLNFIIGGSNENAFKGGIIQVSEKIKEWIEFVEEKYFWDKIA
jgi:hypothetical protein